MSKDYKEMTLAELEKSFRAMASAMHEIAETSARVLEEWEESGFATKRGPAKRPEVSEPAGKSKPNPWAKAPPWVQQRMAQVVRPTVDENPYRMGSQAHHYFEAMRTSATIGEYSTRFRDRKKALRKLSGMLSAGHAKVLEHGGYMAGEGNGS